MGNIGEQVRAVTQSVAYAAAHALPAGASAPAQTLVRAYAWNANRTPASRACRAASSNQQSTKAPT
jgi:hypothetical protein